MIQNDVEGKVGQEGIVNSEGVDEEDFPFKQYFKSKEAFLIFSLLHVDGEKRANLLGITEEMYESLDAAKEWKRQIISVIHSDRCKHLSSDEAVAKLNEIYERMKKNGQ